jgi:hypothetical protein
MPLDSNHTLHAWIKYYAYNQSADRMRTEPGKHYLLGFPGVEAEDHHKRYIRKLWLVAPSYDRTCPQFIDSTVIDLAKQVNKVVNTFAQDYKKRYKELRDGAFLENEAMFILNDLGFGWRIWGEGSGAETRLSSNELGPRPRWGGDTDSGYEKNDEDR